MFEFLIENIGTIIVSFVIVAVVCAVLIFNFRARKKGKPTCSGCGCASCAMAGKCHPQQSDK